MEPKTTVNARIVIVGASDTAVSLLETLTFAPRLRFANITLVSPHGLPGSRPKEELVQDMLANSMNFSHEEYSHLSLRTWTNVVLGKMTSIARPKKEITVNNSKTLPYDYLILCSGVQYQVPCPLQEDASNSLGKNASRCSQKRYFGSVPENLFVINDEVDAYEVISWLKENFIPNKENHAVVYGLTLDALACIRVLLQLGIEGSHITLITQPDDNGWEKCLPDETVRTTIENTLVKLGVQMISDSTFIRWKNEDTIESGLINQLIFSSSKGELELSCSAFFCYNKKNVDFDMFKALNDACLVYDGRLVIDATFHTNDRCIRAAGTMTKFQRQYHSENITHAYFNSKDVAVKFAASLLELFDPLIDDELYASERETDNSVIPMYRSPKVISAVIPGSFHYLRVEKPCYDAVKVVSGEDTCKKLHTGNPEIDQKYFSLEIDRYNSVKRVICLSNRPLFSMNYIYLYGQHERCLNSLLARFEEGLISDFYEYFRQPWAMAIFQDRFLDFKTEVRELTISSNAEDSLSLEDKVREVIKDNEQVSEQDMKNLKLFYSSSGNRKAVETRLLNFLSYNSYHLPMYARPGMI